MAKIFLTTDVLAAARERVAFVFDRFENVVVSVSSGKDSTVLYWLAVQEAQKRGRKVGCFFLDQEAEYQATVELMESMVDHPSVIPMWYQVPIRMTNATSYKDEFLTAWGEGQEWMRPKDWRAIHQIESEYPDRFYDFFYWIEKVTPDTAFLIGLRAEESLNRLRSVIKNPGYEDVTWSTKTKNESTFRFYPIFDWGMGDVWKFIGDHDVPYNKIYDLMLQSGQGYYNTMRVSNLIHEKSFTCLTSLQEMEPETFERIIKRIGGVHAASIYAKEDTVYSNKVLPDAYASWGEYRDYLLSTTPLARKDRFEQRFAKQERSEDTARQQVKQLLLNDWENSLGVTQGKAEKRRAKLLAWKDKL